MPGSPGSWNSTRPFKTPTHNLTRARIRLQGLVQGVGFRPFVYRLAAQLGLAGWVRNHNHGVLIEVEGLQEAVEGFLERLPKEKPAIAQIHRMEVTWTVPQGETAFRILASEREGLPRAWVLPDLATCPACLEEVLDPGDRRHRYPFTNCTHCGPRFSIILALPYDRPRTTMARFPMCPACRQEYHTPENRRFHAQPNACPVCGPTLAFYTPDEPHPEITHPDFPPRQGPWGLQALGEEALQRAVRWLREGRILAVKGLGGFHLMVDARKPQAVARLRERKPRKEKPFALMARDLDQARALGHLSPEEAALLRSPQAPIVLLPRRAEAPVAGNVAPDNPYLGVMLPYTPLHHLLLREHGGPLVATSGNRTDEPICTDEREALERLGPVADAFLVHNRPIARHVDDSVVQVVRKRVQVLRRARGYVPLPFFLPHPTETILAVGGQLKNTVAVSVEDRVIVSQHIGDLDDARTLATFQRVLQDLLTLYEVHPRTVVHDLHPDYGSTRWVRERQSRSDWPWKGEPPQVVAVQHHHAHLAACLAEHGFPGPALGATWDGTGYGPDGTVWGGEFLLGDERDYRRVATLRAFRLPGGDAAIKAPKRVALALLWEMWGPAALAREDLAPIQALTAQERRGLARMLERGFRSPLTTSMGRLFDGVAALLGLRQEVSFEAQAAMALEFVADASVREGYPMDRRETETGLVWDWAPMLEALLQDLRRGEPVAVMAGRFHRTLVQVLVETARYVGVERVALTGGVFQNRLLTAWAQEALEAAGFTVLVHRRIPPNDGGLSLGQAAIAAARQASTSEVRT